MQSVRPKGVLSYLLTTYKSYEFLCYSALRAVVYHLARIWRTSSNFRRSYASVCVADVRVNRKVIFSGKKTRLFQRYVCM